MKPAKRITIIGVFGEHESNSSSLLVLVFWTRSRLTLNSVIILYPLISKRFRSNNLKMCFLLLFILHLIDTLHRYQRILPLRVSLLDWSNNNWQYFLPMWVRVPCNVTGCFIRLTLWMQFQYQLYIQYESLCKRKPFFFQ